MHISYALICVILLAFPAISQQFMDTGFAPAKSKKTQTAVETIAQEGQGIIRLSSFSSISIIAHQKSMNCSIICYCQLFA